MINAIMPQTTVFLVDTDDHNLKMMQQLLDAEHVANDTYRSPEEFLQHYQYDRPGCLVADLQLPRLDGLQLMDRLRSQQLDLPVIFLLSRPDVGLCVEAMKAGAVDVLEKPISRQPFVDAVRRALNRDTQVRENRDRYQAVMRRLTSLTARQRETLELIVAGLSTKEIASKFGVGIQTAAKHRARVLAKMDVNSDVALTRLCLATDLNLPPLR